MLNPIEEAKFAELRGVCRELKVPAPPEIFIGLKVHDKNGIMVFDDVQRGHSWTRIYWNTMFGIMADAANTVEETTFGAGKYSTKVLNGTIVGVVGFIPYRQSGSELGYGLRGGIGIDTMGIVVGTGDTAFGLDQYCLVTPIAHGNAAGQFAYSAQAANALSYVGGTKTWKNAIARIFNNNSGGSITVKEVGLYAGYVTFNTSSNYMWERSVLSPTVAVADGAQLTVTYEISMGFAAID
jgi:hypothetical protein